MLGKIAKVTRNTRKVAKPCHLTSHIEYQRFFIIFLDSSLKDLCSSSAEISKQWQCELDIVVIKETIPQTCLLLSNST